MIKTLGHEKIEKILGLLSDVAIAVVKAKEDGQFGLEDVQHFIPLLASVMPAIAAIAGVGEEIKSLSAEEIMELVKKVIDKLDPVMDDKLAAIIKQALVCAVETAKLISIVRS